MNKIDEIALRVADKYDPRENYFPYRNDLLLYVKELLAELSNEEKPVAYGWVEDGELKALSFVDIPFKPQYSPAAVKSPLFTHPAPVIASEQKPVGEGYIRDGKIIAVKLKDVELVMRLPEGVTLESLYLHPAPIPEGWISVDDRFPESDEEVLVFPPPSDYCITASYGHVAKAGHQKAWEWGEYETGYGHVNHKYQPTHWMPLPQPPMAAARSE